VLQLAERAGLQRLVAEHVQLGKPGGVNAHLKIPAWWQGCWPARIRSMTWRCCGTVR
jgi:hypothetical protein